MKPVQSATAFALACTIAFAVSLPALGEDRMPPIAADKLTEAQKKAAADFEVARKVPVFGPFVPLERSPELMLAASNMGLYLRYHTSLPLKINEFVILMVARA